MDRNKNIKAALYLGDGVYVTSDGYHLVLFTHDGIREQAKIYLDPEVLAAFDSYRAAIAPHQDEEEG